MAKLIYSGITSLDGYVADEDGNFDWVAPTEEVHTFVNDAERPIGTYLYGRGMYGVMRYWETADAVDGQPPFMRDYAEVWQAADKIVYSRTLETVPSARTRIERNFDPEMVRRMKKASGRFVWISSCWTSVGSPAASFTFTTARIRTKARRVERTLSSVRSGCGPPPHP
jgi:RibD domain-containing protein